MKKIIATALFSLSLNAGAEIVTSRDAENNCKIFRVTSEEAPALPSEKMMDTRSVYGLTLKNLVINFEKKTAEVKVIKRTAFGFDRSLTENPVVIRAANPLFQSLINQLNYSVRSFEKVCLTDENELVYASPLY